MLTCAPLLHRTGQAEIWRPGGCSIGERPVGYHLEVLRAFGASTQRTATGYKLTAPGGLRGAVIDLPFPSVGATEQFLLGAVVAAGDSVLSNAAVEPEIMDLIGMLQRMGALITVRPNRSIQVTGVHQLRGVDYTAIPDRLEAASWAGLALATDGRITVNGVRQGDLATYLNVYRRAGGDFEFSSDGGEVTFWRERPMPRPLVIETDVHPGFMTDWQPPLVTALTQADGVTVLHETVYEDRLGYTEALRALGAQIQVFTECLGSDAVPVRLAQPPALRGHRRAGQAAGHRPARAGPAGRLLVRAGGAVRAGHLDDQRGLAARPGLRELPRQAARGRRQADLSGRDRRRLPAMTTARHLVLGAGSVGTAVAELLAADGAEVVVLTRSGAGPDRPGVERVRGDAGDAAAVDRGGPRCGGHLQLRQPAVRPVGRAVATDRGGAAGGGRVQRGGAGHGGQPLPVRAGDRADAGGAVRTGRRGRRRGSGRR